jgi:carbamoyltransferase
MKIIGINEWSHDVGIAVVENGKIICLAEEERFNRRKHYSGFSRGGGAPLKATKWALNKFGYNSLSEFDCIVIPWEISLWRWVVNVYWELRLYKTTKPLSVYSEFKRYKDIFYQNLHRQKYIRQLNKSKKVISVDHHLSHASVSYRTSPFDDALIVIIDGAGETVSTSVYVGKNNNILKIKSYPVSQSVGRIYSAITALIGFGEFEEGKTMALADFGTIIENMKLLEYEKHKDCFVLHIDNIKSLRRYARQKEQAIDQIHRNIAATIQYDLNCAVLELVRSYIKKTGIKNICFGGGVALNCKLNNLIIKKTEVEALYSPPGANDSTTPLGAALEVYSQKSNCFKIDLRHAFWGYKSNQNEIKKSINDKIINSENIPQNKIVKNIANSILAGKIIGICRGSAEIGPRALGNRSILGDARIKNIADLINEKVKHREKWRPFAAMVLEEDLLELFNQKGSFPYMNVAFYANKKARQLIPGIIHIDGSVRVQTVNDKNSIFFTELLQEIKKETGYGILLNTSFNDSGEPIVNSPIDAISTFQTTNIEVLYLENYKITKEKLF